MTKSQRISRALALLNSAGGVDREKVSEAITYYDNKIRVKKLGGHDPAPWRLKNYKEKQSARQLHRALRSVENQVHGPTRSVAAVKIINLVFSGDEYELWLCKLKNFREVCLSFSGDAAPISSGIVFEELAGYGCWKLGPPKRSDAWEKRAAAEAAAGLLEECGLPLVGKRFRKLAAIFYGDERANLNWHCDNVRRQSNRN